MNDIQILWTEKIRKQKKQNTIAGLLFILSGILSSAVLLANRYIYCLDRWKNDCKANNFSSFKEYFFSTKTEIAIYFIVGFILIVVGICFLFKKLPKNICDIPS